MGSNSCTDYTIMGDVANIACRIQSIAKPGEILVSDEVYDAVSDVYPGADGRAIDLKGIDYPVQAFSLD